MKLSELAQEVEGATVRGDPSTTVRGLASHTRDVTDGTLFFCVPGHAADGHEYAAAAAAAGAVALVCERELPLDLPQVLVPSVRAALPAMAAHWFGHPSRELTVVGVTGTNGKTTTAHLVAAILTAAGRRSGLLGTVVNRVGGEERPVRLTTADPIELQRMLREMVAAGDRAVAFEVSSHALDQGRAEAVDFDAVVFTNLTRDHLDYHGTFEDYYAAKRRLFLTDAGRRPRAVAVVNVGDGYGARLAEECRPAYGDDLWTCAVDGDGAAARADARATALDLRADGSSFRLVVPRLALDLDLSLPLAARFNVENALLAAVAALVLGVDPGTVRAALAAVPGVPGRFEAVRAGQPFTVLVDYSHTPDSLENALRAARAVTSGRLIVVFGCGGDRDRGKRPLMGDIASRLADLAVVTSDNPRSEDPEAIVAEILSGVAADRRARVLVEPERGVAIRRAVAMAGPGDTVLVAGKGHERGQIVAGRTLPFDDREVARQALRELAEGDG